MKINADMCFVLHHMNVSMQHRVLLIVVERGIMATTRKSDLFVRGKTEGIWGCSSNGRALASHARGTGFDPHHFCF